MKGEYYKTKESVEEYIRLAKDANGAQLIEKLKKVLPLNSTFLELGTGPGTDWNILKKDYQITGSDYSIEFLSHLETAHPNHHFLQLDASTIDTPKKFDGIYSNKVLHHLNDNELQQSIQRQWEVLNPEGIICHSFWQGEGSEIFKGLFVNYHSKQALKTFFQDSFEILTLESYAEFEEGDSLQLLGRKKL